MREKDLPFDRAKHVCYTKNAKKCVKRLLSRCYDEKTAAELWEKIQLKYCDFLKDEPALSGVKMTVSIYDPILIFAWYAVVPDKPPLEEIQQEIFDCFLGGFNKLGKIFNINRKLDNRLANLAFKNANDLRVREIQDFPASFRMGGYSYNKENGVVRYSFTQCPNAEFAKRHHMEDVLPVMCNCDHLAMQKLHAALIREGTCCTSACCDYCIVGDQNPIAAEYELVRAGNGLWVSVKKDRDQEISAS
ncbi:MAG: L-2-amino-thiazoline-4-carboxylic acid hydrolase [Oscillospiraceae bacterium]|nr:L-2-amino-thiazoline-4-carboxylic acid hydrolase [Oscillospiraceae bacterium]